MTISASIHFPSRNVFFGGFRLAVNYILPLLILPYLLTNLGGEAFGKLMLTQAVILYFILMVEYGFSLTGARAVSKARHSPMQCAALLVEINTTKLIMALALAICLAIFGRLMPDDLEVLLLVGFIGVLGAALQPMWFFQGLEEFPLVSTVQVFARITCLVPVIFLVNGQDDFLLAQALMMAPWLLSGTVLGVLAHLRYRKNVTHHATIGGIVRQLRDGLDVFLSQIATSFFTGTNTIIVGSALGATAAGYFAMADKIVRAIAQLSAPICEALFPRISGNIEKNRPAALNLARKVLIYGGAAFVVTGILLIVFSGLIANLVAKGAASEVALIIRIMAFVPFMVFANNIFGTQILLTLGWQREFRNSVLISGLVLVALCLLLTKILGLKGAPIAIVAGEFLILSMMFFYSTKAVGNPWMLKGEAAS